MQWGCLIKKTHLHNERLVSFPCPQWAQSWQQHCLSAALGLHQHWDLFPSHKWSKGDLKHAVSARTTQGTYSKAKSSQWHLINSSLPPAEWYCLDFLGAQLPPLPKVSQHQERLLHLILRIGWRPKVFPCSVWSVWVTETSPHSWSSVLFANIPILKFHNVSWKILIIDYMQLFCLSRSFLLFSALELKDDPISPSRYLHSHVTWGMLISITFWNAPMTPCFPFLCNLSTAMTVLDEGLQWAFMTSFSFYCIIPLILAPVNTGLLGLAKDIHICIYLIITWCPTHYKVGVAFMMPMTRIRISNRPFLGGIYLNSLFNLSLLSLLRSVTPICYAPDSFCTLHLHQMNIR